MLRIYYVTNEESFTVFHVFFDDVVSQEVIFTKFIALIFRKILFQGPRKNFFLSIWFRGDTVLAVSVTRKGNFKKFSVTNAGVKVAQILVTSFGAFLKDNFIT